MDEKDTGKVLLSLQFAFFKEKKTMFFLLNFLDF